MRWFKARNNSLILREWALRSKTTPIATCHNSIKKTCANQGPGLLYPSHFKIRRLYLLPLGESKMRNYKKRILKCDGYKNRIRYERYRLGRNRLIATGARTKLSLCSSGKYSLKEERKICRVIWLSPDSRWKPGVEPEWTNGVDAGNTFLRVTRPFLFCMK